MVISISVVVPVYVTAVVRVAIVRVCREAIAGPRVRLAVAKVRWDVADRICPLNPLVGQLSAATCEHALAWRDHLFGEGKLLAVEN